MATKKLISNNFHSKKEVKKELAHKIEIALPELKQSLGKKKFKKRIKKAARLITEGLHLNGADNKKNNTSKREQAGSTKTSIKKNSKQIEPV